MKYVSEKEEKAILKALEDMTEDDLTTVEKITVELY